MPATIDLIHGAFADSTASVMDTHDPGVHDHPAGSPDRPTLRERLGETVPLIGAPAWFGPPVIFLLGPWLLLVLLLIPPTALLITMVVVLLLAVGLFVALGALIASPYLLLRHLRARHSAPGPAPSGSEVPSPRGGRPVKQPIVARLIHLTTR